MAKSREQKEMLLEMYKDTLNNNSGYLAVDVKGVNNESITNLKKKLKDIGSNVIVVSNKLFQIALRETNQPTETLDFAEQTAIIPYADDPTAPAKLIKEVQKETEALPAKHGLLKGQYLNDQKVMELAEIPAREVLLAKLLGSMNSPLTVFANAVTGNARGFVQVLKQVSEK